MMKVLFLLLTLSLLLLLTTTTSHAFVVPPLSLTTTTTTRQEQHRTTSSTTTQLYRRQQGNDHDDYDVRLLKEPQLYKAFDKKPKKNHKQLRMMALSKVKNAQHLTSILSNWAKSNAKDAAERSHEVLQHLRSTSSTSTSNTTSNTFTNNNALLPTTFLYNVVMNAYARRKRADKAEEVLREMMMMNDDNQENATPSHVSFSTVIAAYAKSNLGYAPDKCMALLQDMKKMQGTPGWDDVGPDVVTYNCVLSSLVKHGRVQEAEDLLRNEMLDTSTSNVVLPDVISFNLVMHGWLKKANEEVYEKNGKDVTDNVVQEHEKAIIHNQELMNELKDLARWTGYNDKRTLPNRMTYSVLIETLAIHGSTNPQEAQDVLFEMIQDDNVVNDITIDVFEIVFDGWSKSKVKDAPERCMKLYEELKELSKEEEKYPNLTKPTSEIQRKVIAVYAKHGRKKEATNKLWWKVPTTTNEELAKDLSHLEDIRHAEVSTEE